MRAARPMTRAEIAQRRTLALVPAPKPAPTTTFDEGTGAFQTEDDDDLVPVRNRSRGVALVSAATLAGIALAAVLTYGDTSREPAALAPPRAVRRTVAVSFSSDPDGAIVTGADGEKLGTTPVSVEIPASETPVVYVFRKDGFQPKAISFIPNVPSPVFGLMQAEVLASVKDAGPQPEPEDERPLQRAPHTPRPAHRRAMGEPPPNPSVGSSVGANVGTAIDPTDPNVDGLMPPSFAPSHP
jgi:hypothetical protein